MSGAAPRRTREELAAWLRLIATPGLGRASVRKLLRAFGSPEAVLGCTVADRRAVAGAALAEQLATPPEGFDDLLRRTEAWLADGDEPHAIVTLGDPGYPPLLLQTADPPLLLHLAGRAELATAPSIAIVGSRNPTPQGREHALAFGRELSNAGWTIVSGLALGVDGAAHEGALAGAGSTVAVVGTGLDQIYPRRHAGLHHRIAQQGLVVSEYLLGTPPLRENFPVRNRLIAGLSRGTLVVEAALQSGSLITARLAAEAGREVFALPGSLHSPQARGCHALIRQGAVLVETAQDIFSELAFVAPTPAEPPPPAAAAEDPLVQALGFDPVGLDELVLRTGLPAAELNARLLDLELSGRVARLPGQLFQRLGRA
ncbi:MAG: DNA-processing protein DprA [Piscinibacter sp.]|uniref:DNA-processing protein DprA n=1 Tax=Piscinibacter sp. TaxID=1903157 RepID=UPI002585AC6D|nr:DNA-processing protein DprA [Piscinibacter sp.]MCW5667662.1 DNA-processing protein DprA [Piscinibacter sp.]